MIRLLRISVNAFVWAFLSPEKRNTKRLALFRGLLTPQKTLSDEVVAWRDTVVTRLNVTGETMSLVWYLNSLFDPTLQRIYIETAPASGVLAGVQAAEPGMFFLAGDSVTEQNTCTIIGLRSETPVFGSNSFIVFVPTAVTNTDDAIMKIVKIYKLAGKSCKIYRF